MTPTRRRVALLAALAVAASLLAYAPAAAAASETVQAPDTAVQTADAGVHQAAVDALAALENVDVFAGTGCADGDGLCPDEPLPRWEMAVWLVRVIDRADPPATSSRYDDVDTGEGGPRTPSVWPNWDRPGLRHRPPAVLRRQDRRTRRDGRTAGESVRPSLR